MRDIQTDNNAYQKWKYHCRQFQKQTQFFQFIDILIKQEVKHKQDSPSYGDHCMNTPIGCVPLFQKISTNQSNYSRLHPFFL